MELLENIVNSNYLVFIPIVIGLVALLYSIKNQRRNNRLQKFKRLECKGRSYTVVNDESNVFSKLSVMYDGETLNNFTSTRLTITNTGNDVIRNNDISSKSPIQISSVNNKVNILAFEIIPPTKEINNVIIRQEKDTLNLEFEFLEPKDQIQIEILHTGKSTADLIGSGKIIGIKQEFNIYSLEDHIKKAFNNNPEAVIKGIFIIIYIFPVLILVIITLIIFLITESINFRVIAVIISSFLFLFIFRKTSKLSREIDQVDWFKLIEKVSSDILFLPKKDSDHNKN